MSFIHIEDFNVELLQTILIFFLMGIFTVMVNVSKAEGAMDFKEVFSLFFINTIAGWGLYSLLASFTFWFTQFPQKVFTILLVTYLGYDTLNWMKRNEILSKIIKLFIKDKMP